MARPTEQAQKIITIRNDLIEELSLKGWSQADIARIFRLPRNTVYMVLKKRKEYAN